MPPASRIFVSYAHADEAWKNRLVTHLKVLELEGGLEVWDDRQIAGGEDWLPAIEEAMDQAKVAVLLITAEFLTSRFVREREVPRLLNRRRAEGGRILPVIVKACAWRRVPWLAQLQCRPTGGRALHSMAEPQAEEALATLADEIAELLSKADGKMDPSSPALGQHWVSKSDRGWEFPVAHEQSPNFSDLLAMMTEPISFYLGDAVPFGEESGENIEAARLQIDLLQVLREKTVGNLSNEENDLLEDLLYKFRLRYVQKRR